MNELVSDLTSGGLKSIVFYSSTQFVQGEFRRTAQGDECLFFGVDPGGNGRDLAGNIERDGLDSVKIAVEQIAGLNFQPTDLSGSANLNNVDVRVRYRNAAGE